MENYIFFWRLNDDNSYLGQWKRSPFTTKGNLKFSTAEQYMMYHKAIYFNDFETANVIYESYNAHPSFHKMMGRKVHNFKMDKWRQVCEDIVFEGNMYKFIQNKHYMKLLLKTDDKILVEASPKDNLWGIGYDADNALINTDKWGENLLGKILMKVRCILREESYDKKYDRSRVYIGFSD